MSSESRWGESTHSTTPATSEQSVTKRLTNTAAARLKAMKQLRQVLRTNRGSLAFEFLVVLRYLPAGIMSRMQQLTGINSSNLSSSSNVPEGDTNKSQMPVAPPFQELKENLPKKPVPISPAGTPIKKLRTSHSSDASLLHNVLEMNSVNNRVIEPKKLSETALKGMKLQAKSVPETKPKTPPKPSISPANVENTDLREKEKDVLEEIAVRDNMKTRTKYLLAMIQKSISKGTASRHNLETHLDDLFSHIYQNREVRSPAIDEGAVRVLKQVLNSCTENLDTDVSVINRTREIMALLGISPRTGSQGIRILSIDGGGVRGLVALEVLRAFESVTGKKTSELFDYICGVSTGSILAFLVGAHNKSLDEAEALYKDLSREIFSQNSIFGNAAMLWNHSYYHTPTFEKILKKHCGEVPLISLARYPERPRVGAISTIVNQERVTPYVFRTYTLSTDVRCKYLGGCRYHMWEAVRASAAAPTYFEEFKLGKYLHQDGGVICNNPTSVAISEAKNIWHEEPLQCVISLGTGITETNRADKHFNELVEHDTKGDTYLSWKGKFLKVLDSATDTEAVHHTISELLSPDLYFRFNPILSDMVNLDEAVPHKLEKAQLETRKYLEQNVDKVEFACKKLVTKKALSKKLCEWRRDFLN